MNRKGEVIVKRTGDGSQLVTGKFYQGIIPPPEIMKEYGEMDPALPDRLLKWSEDEFSHRREIERKFLNHSMLETLVGNFFGFLSIIALGILAYLFMINGHAEEGKWVSVSIAGVVGIFVIRKYFAWKSFSEGKD